jgi:hypothetical protein
MILPKRQQRRLLALLVVLVGALGFLVYSPNSYEKAVVGQDIGDESLPKAVDILDGLATKGRAPKTGYERDMFGSGWGEIDGCDTRNVILQRDLTDTKLDGCLVLSGVLFDPYTGETIEFQRGENSNAVQIDHVVALSDAWQKGAQYFEPETRKQLANDPLNLLAVDGAANQQKSDGDAATWLPANKPFRCEYVARQITVKYKYDLWVTDAEKQAMQKVLDTCPERRVLSNEKFIKVTERTLGRIAH